MFLKLIFAGSLTFLAATCNNKTQNSSVTTTPGDDSLALATSASSSESVAGFNNNADNTTHFGVFIFRLTPMQKVQVTKALGVNYVREGVTYENWKGSSPRIEPLVNAGFKLVLNIANAPFDTDATGKKTGAPFATDLTGFKKFVGEVLDKYPVEVAVIENEEQNKNYHSGTIDEYLAELNAATEVCHAKGVKVTNGGITTDLLRALTYRDLAKVDKQQAEDFLNNCLPANARNAARNAVNQNFERKISEAKKLINAYKESDLDYINIHLYYPLAERGLNTSETNSHNATGMKEIVSFIQKVTGKPVMTNETGVVNDDPELVKNVLQGYKNLGLPYVIWFSGDGTLGARALSNGLDLRQTGITFRDFVKKSSAEQ